MSTKSKSNAGVRWAVGITLAAGLFLSGYLLGAAAEPAQQHLVRTTSGPLGEQARRDASDPFALGSPDAPVVMVVFDYRCPFCARHSTVTEPELVERFVESVNCAWSGAISPSSARRRCWRRAPVAPPRNRGFSGSSTRRCSQARRKRPLRPDPERLLMFAREVGVPDLARFEADMNSTASTPP